MQNIHQIVKQLIDLPKGSYISEIIGCPEEFPHNIIEQISILIARMYRDGNIEYYDADYVMNCLYGYWLHYSADYGFGEIAWECFEAFDAGEYNHTGDDPDIDPVVKYTDRYIDELLNKIDKVE